MDRACLLAVHSRLCPNSLPPASPCLHPCSALLLMRFARRHGGRSPRLLVSLERRVCFALDGSGTAAVTAPAYEYWRTLFEAVEGEPGAAGTGASSGAQTPHKPQLPLVGWQLDVGSVPQALQPYERTAELELWELALREDVGDPI